MTVSINNDRLIRITGAITASTKLIDGSGTVRHIRWNDITADGDIFQLRDGPDSGSTRNIVWRMVAGAAGDMCDRNLDIPYQNGLYCDTLGTGEVLIELGMHFE